ncbi:hypothetical protein KSP39_PZI018609 [Platanthera zijinensis]|uniref:Transcription elongation factor n=1 Tax=Platanthera zijinensis TaxID=2320716 RepID=A0AAP0B2P3_9ASPA
MASSISPLGSTDYTGTCYNVKRVSMWNIWMGQSSDFVEVGKCIRILTKHTSQRIQAAASDLLKFWKNTVIEETSSKEQNKNGNSNDATANREDNCKISEAVEVETSASDRILTSEKFSESETIKIKQVMNTESQTVEIERISVEEKQASVSKHSVPTGPPKLNSMLKCNDPLRDKLRELLAEAFVKVSAEATEDSRREVRHNIGEINACDPIRIAVMVESTMFEKLGRSNGAHKVKYRSIMFNLKDAKNTDLRRKVLLGHVKPEKLVNMTAEEMASDDRKLANKQIQEKALFECERGGPAKATTDQFRCGRCGQRKCTYYQLQTRSADEPMTTFVTCVNCNKHWKFC